MGRNRDLSERLFAAILASDRAALHAMCTPGVEWVQNRTATLNLDEIAGLGAAVMGAMPDYHYEKVVCTDTEHGFVDEHDGVGTLANGTRVEIHSCVVATVDAGKITGIQEYFDSAAVAPLLAALEA